MRMRQKTFFTTRGRFLVGFFVSPAVMAMDSVPPSGRDELAFEVGSGELTCERCCYEDRGEATNAIHERCLWDVPIVGTEVLVGGVTSTVHSNAKDDEDLRTVSNTQTSDSVQLTVMVITLRRLNQYSSCPNQFQPGKKRLGDLTSP
jgi:hypothetical protein